MGKEAFEFKNKFDVESPFEKETIANDSNLIITTNTSAFEYSSPFKNKSIYNDNYLKNEAFERIKRKLKDVDDINRKLSKMPYFGAGKQKDGNPNKNGFAHGDIEDFALKGFYNQQELKEVYYGNWLRDFSQFLVGVTVRPNEAVTKQFYSKYKLSKHEQQILNHFFNVFTQDHWVKILEILATKEFVWKDYFERDKSKLPYTDGKKYINEFRRKFPQLTKDILGIYRPEEHIDNPKEQKDESRLSYINFNYEYEKGKYQKEFKLYKGETAESLFINSSSNSLPASNIDSNGKFVYNPQGLKYYIFKDIDIDRPSSITYFRQQLRMAVSYGDTKHGKMHLGAALHVLEDYFAHTNFVEVSLIKLIDEDVYPWVNYVDETNCKVDIKKSKNFWKDKGKWVIKEPVVGVKNEKANCIPIVTGVFLMDDTLASVGPKIADEFFDLAYEPFKLRNSGERSLFDILVVTILDAYAKKQKAEQDFKKEFDARFWLDIYNQYLTIIDKLAALKNSNEHTKAIFQSIGNITEIIKYVMSFFINLIFNLIFSNSGKIIKEKQNLNYNSNPTHTQIAKDPFDHPLNTLAGILAIEAVKDVTQIYKKSLKNKNISLTDEQIILEKYFAHPSKINWMDKIIEKWHIENKEKLKKLHFPTISKEVEYELKMRKIDTDNFLNSFNSLKELISLAL